MNKIEKSESNINIVGDKEIFLKMLKFKGRKKKNNKIELYNDLLNNAHLYYEVLSNIYRKKQQVNDTGSFFIAVKTFQKIYSKIIIEDYLICKNNISLEKLVNIKDQDAFNKEVYMLYESLSEGEKDLVEKTVSNNFAFACIKPSILEDIDLYHQDFMNKKYNGCIPSPLDETQLASAKKFFSEYNSFFKPIHDLHKSLDSYTNNHINK